jgi:hypothetical protein
MTNEPGWRKSSHSTANGDCVEAEGRWKKSSYSMANGDCVEAEGRWVTSSHSGGANCVEFARQPEKIRVRDSKDRTGPVLEFTPQEWRTFLATLG